jgi:hypothetical protein
MKALFLAAAIILPALALGATICVWNYDSLDRYFDPALGDSADCSYRVRQALLDQGHIVAVVSNLPQDLTGYDAVFCLLGWFRC